MRTWLAVFLLACSTDTFAPPDSGGGDSPAGDAAPCPGPSFCSMALGDAGAAQCTDFDESMAIPAAWQPLTLGVGANLPVVTNEPFKSCPSSLQAEVSPTDGGSGAVSTIATSVGAGLTAKVDVDVLLPQAPMTDTVGYMGVYKGKDQSYAVSFGQAADGKFYLSLPASGTSAVLPNLRTGGWNHISLVATFSPVAGGGTASITYTDGSGAQAAPVKVSGIDMDPMSSPTSAVTVTLGVAFIGGPPADLIADFDDVVVSTQ